MKRVFLLLFAFVCLTNNLDAQLIGTDVQTRYRESDQTLPAGYWRLRLNGDSFSLERNTAAAGDFSSMTVMLSITSSGTVTLPGSSYTSNSFAYFGTSGALSSTSAPTNGQLLIGSTGVAPVVAALTGTSNQVTVTNGAGSITLSLPQNIHSAATPTFAGIIIPTAGPAGGQQHSLPAVASDTVALLAASQTFTNKTLTSPTINAGALSGTFSGDHTYSGIPTLSAAEVRLKLNETDQASDEKLWDFDVSSKILKLRTRTDADGAGIDIFSVLRGTGTAISSFNFGGNIANFNFGETANVSRYVSVARASSGSVAIIFQGTAVDATFQGSVIQAAATRSANTAFNLFIATTGAASDGSGGTSQFIVRGDGQVQHANGDASNPPISFISDTDTGWYWNSSGVFSTTINGVQTHRFTNANLDILTNSASIRLGTSSDVILVWDAANVLAQKNGTTAQESRLYNTFTDASNNEYFSIRWGSNIAHLTTEKNGSGTDRAIRIVSGNDVAQAWEFGNLSGATGEHFGPTNDNTQDLGRAALRVRSGYFGTRVITGVATNATGDVYSGRDGADADLVADVAGTGFNPRLIARRSRGTQASRSKVESSDNILQVIGSAWSGSTGQFMSTAQINFAVDGATTADQRPPSRIEFYTNIANGAQTEALRIDNDGDVLLQVNTQALIWSGRSALKSPADGQLTLFNNAQNDFGRLNFGGVTSSFPALKRSSAQLDFRLADDSAYAGSAALFYSATTYLSVGTTVATAGGVRLANATGVIARNAGNSADLSLITADGSNITVVGNTVGGTMVYGFEISDPAAPASNSGVLYFRDNGSGKTQLVVRFPTGAVQVIATEP